jgi:hypothetical protein
LPAFGAIASTTLWRLNVCMSTFDAKDTWQMDSNMAIYQFAVAVRAFHDSNPWPQYPFLEQAMNTLMTELWDRCFSQTEIREAFQAAINDLPRYAAGEEVRP